MFSRSLESHQPDFWTPRPPLSSFPPGQSRFGRELVSAGFGAAEQHPRRSKRFGRFWPALSLAKTHGILGRFGSTIYLRLAASPPTVAATPNAWHWPTGTRARCFRRSCAPARRGWANLRHGDDLSGQEGRTCERHKVTPSWGCSQSKKVKKLNLVNFQGHSPTTRPKVFASHTPSSKKGGKCKPRHFSKDNYSSTLTDTPETCIRLEDGWSKFGYIPSCIV